MKRLLVLLLVLVPSPAMAENLFLAPVVEMLSAFTWKDNYKRVPQLTDQSLSNQHQRLKQNNTDKMMVIYSANCRRFYSEEGSGKACLVDDGTWQIIEVYKN